MESSSLAAAWQAFIQGRYLEAERLATAQASARGDDPEISLLFGVLYAKTGRLESAAERLRHAIGLAPNSFEATNWLSFVCFQLQEYSEAEGLARKALTLHPDQSDALNNLGLSLFGQRRYEDAVDSYRKSIAANPGFGTTYENLGSALLMGGRPAEAEIAFHQAIARGADQESVRCSLAEIAEGAGEFSQAVSQARKAIPFNPSSARGYLRLGAALWQLGDKGAVPALERAVELSPENAEAHSILGAALQSAGRAAEAQAELHRSLEIQPIQGAAYFFLFDKNKGDETWDKLREGAEAVLRSETLPEAERSMLSYGLGKAYEVAGNFKGAMSMFDQAKAIDEGLFRQGKPFLPDVYREQISRIIDRFDMAYIQRIRRTASMTRQPIFILGMMRSGTTLLEQIVSCHSLVGAAGERGFYFKDRQLRQGAYRSELTSGQLSREADAYMADLLRVAGDFPFLTDKMPNNHLVVGLIMAAFPKAKILHVRRNPVDTCLSIWSTGNRTPPRFSYKKADVVIGYREYLRLMEHWRQIVPAETMLELDYEQLVEDHEATVRRIIEFLGLPWEEACLRHEQNPNVISTPSLWQARQPIYNGSVNRWRRYEGLLGEFSDLLVDSERT